MTRMILLLLVASATACGITGPNQVTLHIEGTVTAQATGQPVAGAQVILYQPTIIFGADEKTLARTTTDAQGHYALTQAVDKNCIGALFGIAVSASASGFEENGSQIGICSDAVQRIDLSLSASAAP